MKGIPRWIVLVFVLLFSTACSSGIGQTLTPTNVAAVAPSGTPTTKATTAPTRLPADTSTAQPSKMPSATATKINTATATATVKPTNTPLPTATLSVAPSNTPTRIASATRPAASVLPEQLALQQFVEGRNWLNATAPNDVPKSAAKYFMGKALQQTLEEARWEIENNARYKVGEVTDNLWSGRDGNSVLIFEMTRAGKVVQFDADWKPVNAFDVNPFSIVYVMLLDPTDRRWKVDHTQLAVDLVTGKSVLEQ